MKMAKIMDGRKVALFCKEYIHRSIPANLTPCLAVIQVGNDLAGTVYVRNKRKAFEDMGWGFRHIVLPECSTDGIKHFIRELNADASVHGIIVQLPLPSTIDTEEVLAEISPDKDVDGFNHASAFVPCTTFGIMQMLAYYGIQIEGKHAVVVGRSDIVGKPTAKNLLANNATVTMCHSYTPDLAEHTRMADILVVAAGKPKLITADMVKPGAVVIDVGINRVDGKLVGDVDFDTVKDVAGWITPVPGGVGVMTVASLLFNTLIAAKAQEW